MTEIAGKLFTWINTRLPIANTFERHLSKHPVPSKVNFWYLFGALAAVTLIIQIVTGIWLIMPYSNTCLLYTSPSPRDWMVSRMPSSA